MSSPQMQMQPMQSMQSNKGLVGLTNIGNTCYGNATLQAVRHQVDLTMFILQGKHNALLKKKSSDEKTNFLEKYGQLVESLWKADSSTEDTRPLWKAMVPAAIKAGFEQFRIPLQHDAHEFLVFMLDQFHEAMSEEVNMTISANNSSIKGALEFWKQSFEKNYSPLVELVFGLQRKSVMCECKKESISWETLNMIKASVPKTSETIKLLDLLVSEGNADTLTDYHCVHCPKRTTAVVTRSFWRLGNWVIIVLKRNENNGRKITTLVDIPMETKFTSLFYSGTSEPSAKDTYELFATINHHGSSGGGHYTSCAKHPVTGGWAFYDDECGRSCDVPLLNSTAYILMYRRVTKTKIDVDAMD